jgi:hypothetical protein
MFNVGKVISPETGAETLKIKKEEAKHPNPQLTCLGSFPILICLLLPLVSAIAYLPSSPH